MEEFFEQQALENSDTVGAITGGTVGRHGTGDGRHRNEATAGGTGEALVEATALRRATHASEARASLAVTKRVLAANVNVIAETEASPPASK